MATYRFPETGTTTYDNGKYYVEVTVTSTPTGMSFSATYHVTNDFKSARYFYLYVYNGTTGQWVTTKSKKKRKAVGTYTLAGPSVVAETAKIKIKVGGDSEQSQDEITCELEMPAPTEISVNQNNVASHTITVTGQGYATKQANKVIVERTADDGNSWSQVGEDIEVSTPTGSYSVSITDTGTSSGNKYRWRAKAYSTALAEYSKYIYSEYVYTNANDDGVSSAAVSVSGNVATVTWSGSVSDVSKGVVTAFKIFVAEGSGVYNLAGTVQAKTSGTSYSFDYNVADGGTYTFAIQPTGTGGDAYEKTVISTTIETKPSAPTSLEAYRNASSGIVVNINGGSSSTVDKVYVDRSADGGSTWTNVVAGEDYPYPTYTDSTPPSSGTIVYRARFYNAQGYSGYTLSNTVSALQKPEAPDIVSPQSGTPIDITENTVRLTWKHKPLDGSPQTAAYIQYKINSGSWQTITVTTATYYDLTISSMSANDVVTWKVSTKGSFATASEYSSESTFTILTRPTLAFTSPQNAGTITSLPVTLAWTYSDACGTLESLTVKITKDNEVVKTFNVDVGAGASGSYSYSLAGFLFDNNSIYGLTASALSSSGLSATQTISVTIAYTPVSLNGGLIPVALGDSETGYARILIMRDVSIDPSTEEPYTPVSISQAYLYRIHDGEKTLVSAVSEGMQITDKYAPINVQYEYELMLITTGGQLSLVDVALINESPYWFIYWGDNIAKAKWNPEGSVSLSRPQRTQVRYSGRRYPVSYDQDAVEETFDFSATILEREDLNLFRQMMRDGGQGIWKSGDGDVYDADFEFDYSADYTQPTLTWNASLSVTRIDGGE